MAWTRRLCTPRASANCLCRQRNPPKLQKRSGPCETVSNVHPAQCSMLMAYRPELAGKRVRCPKCRSKFSVPDERSKRRLHHSPRSIHLKNPMTMNSSSNMSCPRGESQSIKRHPKLTKNPQTFGRLECYTSWAGWTSYSIKTSMTPR